MRYSFDNIVKKTSLGTWQWSLPVYFNICEACVDQHAKTAKAQQIALMIEDERLGQSSITYQQLSDKTSQLANILNENHVTTGDRVLIRLANSLAYPVSFFGCIKYGAIAVPTSTLLSASEVAYLAKDSGAKVLVTEKSIWSELSEQLDNTQIDVVLLTGEGEMPKSSRFKLLDFEESLDNADEQFDTIHSQPDDPAYLVYTSGTTGYPKGVLHAHRALLGRLPASKFWFDLSEDTVERIMHSGKFNWTYVLGSALMDPLLHGHTVIAYEGSNDAATWPQLIDKHRCSIFIGVPTIYRQIIQKTDYQSKDLPSLKHCMSAGEHLSNEMQELWESRFGKPIYEAIGMSEVSYYISQHKGATVKPGAAGFIQPGHYVELLDGENHPVDLMQEGMICIAENDPGLFLEYWNLPEETKKAKHNGWFYTGDFAKRDKQGYIWFLGRKDDIINTFGYRVSPHEVERVLKTHEKVADCVVVGEQIAQDKTLVVACVIPEPNVELSEEEIYSFGLQQLAQYKAPKKVYLMQDFPRTKNGKVLRKQMVKDLSSYP